MSTDNGGGVSSTPEKPFWRDATKICAIRAPRRTASRMKTIALIDTRPEIPGVSLGVLVSAHDTVAEAFAANEAFQKTEVAGRHIRTKIVTLKDQLQAGMVVQPSHLAESK